MFWRTCHLVTSQDGTGYLGIQDWGVQADIPSGGILGWYPGIVSIQGLGCLGGHAIWEHPRMVLGILGYYNYSSRIGCSGEHTIPG